ncbi:MAG: helix-turn-helix domain-containing protein [Clostridia bacterium]|nr:helix-turn-helix domain-containing protein [Clostridia bacterium]
MGHVVLNELNKHFTVDEIFNSPIFAVSGFTEKNYSIGMHSQEFYEINIVLSGKATHIIDERSLTVRKGDTFIVPPNVLHSYVDSENLDVYHILISPKYLEKHSAELKLLPAFSALFRIDPLMRQKTSAKLHFVLSETELASLMPTLEDLTVHSEGHSAENAIIAGGEALIAIARLCSIYESKGIMNYPTETEDEAFLASIAYIYENFDKTVTIDTLAKIARMSRTSYISRFKRVTGMPPAIFQRNYRVSVAKQMLSDKTQTEAEIAQAVGCYDTSHFIRMFRAETSMTPSEFCKTL